MKAILAGVLLWIGIVLELFAVLGLSVMRNVFDRLHYVSLAGYGTLVIGVSILVRESFSLIGDKALLTGLLVAAASPVVVHVTARSMRIRMFGDWRARRSECVAPEDRA